MLTIQLLAVALALVTGTNPQSWGGEDLLLQPNSTSLNFSLAPALELDSGSSPSAQDLLSQDLLSQDLVPQTNRCNITVLRLVSTSLLARWERSLGFNCDVLLFTTSSNSRSSFSAAFSRVFPPVIIDHVGVGGGQQEFKLCVGCGGTRHRRVGRRRTSDQGQQVNFCCLDFSLEELSWDTGWRLNRKPIESTLVACFMTMVIVIWSVAALIWPVPIIAGFLPNGMEQRRG